MRLLLAVTVACSSAAVPPPPQPAPSPRDAQLAVDVATDTAVDGLRWLAGDMHMHVAPPDTDAEVSGTLAGIVASAKQANLDFVVLTPHIRESTWQDDRRGRQRAWRELAANARAVAAPTMIPGIEWTTNRGHFSVFDTDVGAIDSPDFLTAARQAGAIISVNHPFAVPTHLTGVAISDYDMSYRVWTDGAKGFTAIDGAEVWNVPLSLANLVSRPGGHTGEERAWTELDRIVRTEHRRVIAVGGSDDHHGNVVPTTWVLAHDASEPSIIAGIRAGATCVGGPEAGTLRARGDGGDWVHVGGAVTGHTVTLAWTGTARVFVDDHDRGEHDGGYVDDAGDALHTYRIELGRSRSGFVYANL